MKKFKIIGAILLVCLLFSSCTVDEFLARMGVNIMGMVGSDISSVKDKVGDTTTSEELKEKNPDLVETLEKLTGDDLPPKILDPLDPEVADDLAAAAQDPDDKELEKLKNQENDWSEDEQESIKNTIEVVAKIFKIYNSDGTTDKEKIPYSEGYENETDVGKVFRVLQNSLSDLYESPDDATEGDVAVLQYSLTVLSDVSTTIKDLNLVTKPEDGSAGETIDNLGSLMTSIDKGEISLDDILDAAEDDSSVVNKLLGEVTTFVDVLGKASNLTDGIDVSSIISGLFSSSDDKGDN